MIFFWKQRLKSLEQLISVSEQITDGNFSVQVQEKGRYEEFNQLSACINEMSRRLQEQTGRLEENKKQMLHHNVRQDQMQRFNRQYFPRAENTSGSNFQPGGNAGIYPG